MAQTLEQQYNDRITAFRAHEYPMIGSKTYLDHAGTTLPSRSLMESFTAEALSNIFVNPHSSTSFSQSMAQDVDDIRIRALHFFGADPDDFDIVFVANATAGVKLVAESLRDNPQGFWYGYHKDSHTSLVGVRELAEHGSHCFQTDAAVEKWFESKIQHQDEGYPILFAYPGQSNMNGRRLPSHWPGHLRKSQHKRAYTLFDAAALAVTAPLNLKDFDQAPDFTVVSFYKIFGFPDLGALIVHNRAKKVFYYRRYFGGGTVDAVSCLQEQWHIPKSESLHSRIEDGTLPLRNIVALRCAMDTHQQLFVNQSQVSKHTGFLAKTLYHRMRDLKHVNDQPVFKIYVDNIRAYEDASKQGPILAFNVLDTDGYYHSCHEIGKLASLRDIQMRIGTLCNPGGVAEALGTDSQDLREAFDAGVRCGSGEDVRDGRPMAMARISLGAQSILQDIDNFINFIEEFFMERAPREVKTSTCGDTASKYHVEAITVFPIKSCGGWSVPPGHEWPIWKEGLAWDRQWCLVHQGTKALLNQKRSPKMALLKPSIDLSANLLRIQFDGPMDPSVPHAISIPLDSNCCAVSSRLSTHGSSSGSGRGPQTLMYQDLLITKYFTTHLGIPCYLSRIVASTASRSRYCERYGTNDRLGELPISPTKFPVPGAFPTPPPSPPPSPRTFSNESPILAISRTSVERINQFRGQDYSRSVMKASAPPAIEPITFRANILLAPRQINGEGRRDAQPFEEETWSKLRIYRPTTRPTRDGSEESKPAVEFHISGRCQRCQMICIDQQNGSRQLDAFTTLAKLRKGEKGVSFGIHCTLAAAGEETESLDPCLRVGDWVDGILEA